VGKKWRLVLVAVFAVLAVVFVGAPPARGQEVIEEPVVDDGAAQEGEPVTEPFVPLPVDQLVALPGSCPIGAPIEPGTSVDCFFEILPGVDVDVLRFSDVVFEGVSWRCHVELGISDQDRLVCPGLLRDRFEEGTVDLTLRVEGEVAEAAASITLTWGSDPGFSLFGDGEGESVVFDGRPLRWFSYSYEPIDGLFLNFRERSGVEIVGTVEIEVAEVFESADGSVFPELPVGRYRLWPCVGTTPQTCEELPGGRPFQVIDGEPLELVPGHNRVSANRINVVFVSSGLERVFAGDSAYQLPELARTLLAIGGPGGVDINDELVGEGELADRLLWGPMAIEPLASHVDRFNFWYLADEIGDEVGILFGGLDTAGDSGFDLPNLQITALYNDGSDFTSDARRTSFESLQPSPVPARGAVRFGDARVWVPQFGPLSGATTLAHEWGHGLFGLRDEYFGFDDRGIATGFPNCAPDIETAERWWGDLAGAVDPFVDEVLEAQESRLQNAEFAATALADRTAVEIIPGGCYSDVGSTEVFRPTSDSLMNSELPVFGVVNRQRVQEVLDRFSSRGPVASLDDITISCQGIAGFVNCRGELATFLDKPLSTIALNSNPCEFGSARLQSDGSAAPVPITCATVGDPSTPVELSFRSESVTIEVVDVNLPPTPSLPGRVLAERESFLQGRALAEQAAAEEAAGAGPGRVVTIVLLLGVAACSLGFVRRRRSSENNG